MAKNDDASVPSAVRPGGEMSNFPIPLLLFQEDKSLLELRNDDAPRTAIDFFFVCHSSESWNPVPLNRGSWDDAVQLSF
jgi:hypothetical protein